MERLQMSQPKVNVCIQANYHKEAHAAVTEACEDLLVMYLSKCYKRLSVEENSLIRKLKVKS